MKYKKLTKIQLEQARECKRLNREIEAKVDKYRDELWDKVELTKDEIRELENSNYEYEKRKHMLKGYDTFNIIVSTIFAIITTSILISNWIRGNVFGNFTNAFCAFYLLIILLFGFSTRDYLKYRKVKKNFKELGLDKDDL